MGDSLDAGPLLVLRSRKTYSRYLKKLARPKFRQYFYSPNTILGWPLHYSAVLHNRHTGT
eukprot:SAG11_NODE_2716_length_3044_cov_10.981362_1_plen_60_part_00